MPTVNPSLLTLAREYRGLTQQQLAKTAGVSQGYVSKFENGLLSPSHENLAKIAQALDWPTEFFFREDRVYGFASACIYHRKRASMPVGEVRQVQALVNVTRMNLAPMLSEVAVQAENRFHRMDVDAFESPTRIAQLLRADWQLPLGPVENLVEAIESAGGIVYRTRFGTRLLDAVSHWTPGMPPLFFINAEMPGDRVRFTLAHELGHVIMHAVPTSEMEAEADEFAGEFLMPARDIANDLRDFSLIRAAELKPYWKVSMQALIMRAKALGAISPKQAGRLFAHLSKLGYRKAEPLSIPVEQPTIIPQVVDIHRRDHGYSVAELSAMAGLSEREFREQYLNEERVLRVVQ